MANNVYGTVRQAIFNPAQDVDIYYFYKPTRSSMDPTFTGFKKIEDPTTMLETTRVDEVSNLDTTLPGMYNLKLPVNIFGNRGIYTVYIVPKEIVCEIKDIGSLAAYPDIRGIVIDASLMGSNQALFGNDNLVGYRVEYFENDGSGQKRQEYFRLITSASFCDPVSQNLTSSNSSANGYRYNANGSLSFLTVTPSTSPSFRANALPYIGVPNQKIVIKNTKFDPVCVEIEITDHDIETVSYMLEGEQVRNLENGRVSTYNFDGEIYRQMEYSTVKDNYTGKSIAELKTDKSDNIDRSLDLNQLKNAE